MQVNLAYKYRLYPAPEQAQTLNSIFTMQRRNWNCLLGETKKLFEDKDMKTSMSEKMSIARKAFQELLKKEGNEWMKEVLGNHRYTAYTEQALTKAWSKYFEDLKSGKVKQLQDKYLERVKLTGKKFKKAHFDSICKPKFKSRFDKQSFTCDVKGIYKSIDFDNGKLYLQTTVKEILELDFTILKDDKIYKEDINKICNVTISKDNTNAFYLSVAFQSERVVEDIETIENPVGIDLGCKTLAVLSDGSEYQMADTSRIDVQIKNLQEKLSKSYETNKDTEGWDKKNWQKLKLKIAKLNKRKANIRSNTTHKMTNDITNRFDFIGLEDLNVKGLTKEAAPKLGEDGKTFVRNNKKQKAGLNRSILDKNFFEISRQLAYKSEWKGGLFQKIGRFFASSKLCNDCGHKFTGLTLAHREWICEECGTVHDRDANASKNIEDEALRLHSK